MSERQFIEGLATHVDLDPARFDEAGTTVIGHESRAGSSQLACYSFRSHTLVWGDPEVFERALDLAGPDPVPFEELDDRLGPAGFARKGAGLLRLAGPAGWSSALLAPGYELRGLPADDPQTLPLIRAFTERCDPDDVEEADLDQLDDLDDAAMTAVLHDGDAVAYAGGGTWPWDGAFADIGVLVHGEHRRRGLAAAVVARCCDGLFAEGRIPLYRHAAINGASAATADRLGFETVARIDLFVAA